MMTARCDQKGFSLLELVVVITITGLIAATLAIFIKGPVDSYFSSLRRAALTDAADTAVRRLSRDIRKALPNSTRIPNSDAQCLELIPTKMGGRYRGAVGVAAFGDILNFVAADSSFSMLGRNSDLPEDQQIRVNDLVAVYNLGVPGADAYAEDNTARVLSVVDGVETSIGIAAKLFPLASGGKRFYVIPEDENVVAYVCDDDGKLRRTVRAFGDETCPATGAILASYVGSCSFTHDVTDLQRNAPAQLSITFTGSGETVSLYLQFYMNNTP
jgi:MSHA biogenesis protein MshO